MASRKKSTAESVSDFDPAALDRQTQVSEITQSVADSTRLPEHSRGEPRSHAAAVRHKRQEHAKLTIPAGDMAVHLLDKGDNSAGIGIRVEFPGESKDRPTAEERAIIRDVVKGDPEHPTGFSWNGKMKAWHRDIVRPGEHPSEVPPSRPVAIRLAAELITQKLADALKHHTVDPVGYAEKIKQERSQASERVPD